MVRTISSALRRHGLRTSDSVPTAPRGTVQGWVGGWVGDCSKGGQKGGEGGGGVLKKSERWGYRSGCHHFATGRDSIYQSLEFSQNVHSLSQDVA